MSNMFRALNEFLEEVRQLKKENAELKASIEHRNHIENIDHVLSQKTDFRGVFSKIEIDIQPPKGFIKWKEQGE